MKIVIGADIMPTSSNIKYFVSGEMQNIIGEFLNQTICEADFRIFNLETPLTNVASPIKKYGPCHMVPVDAIKGIKSLGVDLITLSNNHIMDQGDEGLKSTLQVLNQNNISVVGVGDNKSAASKPYVINKDGIKIGIYACAEHEFSIASDKCPGANPFDLYESFDHIFELKKQCDYVIVLYHGGKEYYRYPSPHLQASCRKMCDKGADLVICQHSHCIGCKEDYNSSVIVYGQGNFIFDEGSDEYWDSSVLISVVFSDGMSIEYIPLKKENGTIKISHDSNILETFFERSELIKNDNFVEEKYSEFACSMIQNYIHSICGVSIWFRILNKLCGHRLKKKISTKQKLAIINYVSCEAHRELLLKGLEADIYK